MDFTGMALRLTLPSSEVYRVPNNSPMLFITENSPPVGIALTWLDTALLILAFIAVIIYAWRK